MPLLLGDPVSASLVIPDGRERVAYSELMRSYGQRSDRARVMSEYVGAVAAQPPGAFTLTELSATVGNDAFERFRHLLERAKWSYDEIRFGLLCSAVEEGIIAISLEIDYLVTGDEGGRDLLSLVAVGEGWSIPIGWTCVSYPPVKAGATEAIRIGVLTMVEDFARDWHRLDPEQGIPPLISADNCFGEDRELRTDLRARSLEYQLPVPADYNEVEPVHHPYADPERDRTIAEYLRSAPTEGPAIVELEATKRSDAEYGVELGRGCFSIVHPEIHLPPNALSGHRPQARVAELREMRALDLRVAQTLRVADFSHGSIHGTIRHAWLLSVLAVLGRGRFFDRKELER